MNDKKFFIEMYFKDLEESISKTESLLGQEKYYLEAILILSCYIGSFSSSRYPAIDYDSEKYKKVVLEYSGMKDLYELIDIFFFYQWPRSAFKDHEKYKKLKNYDEIENILKKKYGDDNKVKENNRYISQTEFIDCILAEPFAGLDEENIKKYLPLFSLCEMLYRFVRCSAVHNLSFPFVNKSQKDDGSIVYRDNHKITGELLLQTVKNILNNMKSECISKLKYPEQL